jgi:hypothetical protein
MKKLHRQINHDLLKTVARIYILSVQKGMNPMVALMYFYPNSRWRTVQSWAVMARQAGYLPKTTPGKVTI